MLHHINFFALCRMYNILQLPVSTVLLILTTNVTKIPNVNCLQLTVHTYVSTYVYTYVVQTYPVTYVAMYIFKHN